jgi:type II secretory pathway pseudopilin PulG
MRIHQFKATIQVAAFTLAEVVVSIFIVGLMFAGILAAYVQGGTRAEWTGYSLAAQAFGMQQIEQARSAVWDTSFGTERNELTNLNLLGFEYYSSNHTTKGYTWGILDLPYSGTNSIRVTNFVTIRRLLANNTNTPPIFLQLVKVETVWPFAKGSSVKYFTNRVGTYFAPDNRDPNSL